jgi:NADH-quinone oxidoreductase subunit M
MILTSTIFIPLIGAMLILATPEDKKGLIRGIGIGFSAIAFAVTLWMFFAFDRTTSAMQFVERANWIPSFHVQYYLGVDGLSYPMLILTTLLCLLSLVASLHIENRVKEYFFWFLILETGMLGVFAALDFFLFYVFWELTLVPMYFLIGVWGGPKKEYAAIKFFLFTLFGSVFMLLGILAMYFNSEPHTFDMLALMKQHANWTRSFQILVFLGLYLGFAVKIPAFPFHTWLPLAHVEAPTAVSVILAGVLLKMGVYGLLRAAFPMLPDAAHWFMPYLIVIAVINVVYGALCAMAQKDMKKMVAYSSVNHMGYCLLGVVALSATGFNGAVLQMVTHGIVTGSLFLLVGVIYDRAHTRDLDAFGGLGAKLPVYTGLMTVGAMASLGLPGLCGFISEFMCFLGAFQSWKYYVAAATIGILVTAAFLLRMIEKVFLGPFNKKWEGLTDVSPYELAAIVPLTVLTVVLGVYPKLALDLMNVTMTDLASVLR